MLSNAPLTAMRSLTQSFPVCTSTATGAVTKRTELFGGGYQTS